MPIPVHNPGTLEPLREFLVGALGRVETCFDEALRSDLPPVQQLCRHVEAYRGKMLRPALSILSGVAGSAQRGPVTEHAVSDEQVALAAVCEMVHMATLVHDDVLDEADTRRRGVTVNRLRGNEAAVILGDYLFSAAYHLCSSIRGETGREASLEIARTGMTLCSGELLQLHHRENFSIDEETYFEIVKRKTGSLIAAACRLGAILGGCEASGADRFREFGENLGIAFQIQDDLLDLTGNESLVGKPLGRDAELGKMTLPLIHHLANAAPSERGRTLRLLEQPASQADHDAARVHIAEALTRTDSLRASREIATGLVESAKTALAPIPDSPARDMLLSMADAVLTRSY